MKKHLTLTDVFLLLGVLFALTSCDSEHHISISNDTPAQNVLRVTTGDGEFIEIALNENIDSKTLIALQTALSNRLILEAELIEQQAIQAERRTNLKFLYWILLSIIASLTVLGREYLKKEGRA
jgi:hypothetical protein